MPVKRRKSKRRADIDSDEWRYLIDEPWPDDEVGFTHWILEYDYDNRATTLWREYGEAVTAEFVRKHPGARPRMWWRYSAPEQMRDGEDEPTYLTRLGLWLPGERERL